MRGRNLSMRIVATIFAAVFLMTPANAEAFKPMKYLQDAAAVAAIASAVSQLSSCDEDLVFSENKKKDADGVIATVIVACNKFPDDEGNFGRSTVGIEFELDQDGGIGAPVGFAYD